MPDLPAFVARGNGRAYGDAAIADGITISTRSLDRMLAFDGETGLLRAEAGVLLADVIETFLPRGFFPPVVPGTKLVTLGGMIAADVHGKNHHRDGGFGSCVEEFSLLLPSGDVLACSRRLNAELFHATLGGMGLTGTILDAAIRLRPVETGWLRTETVVAPDLGAALAALERNAGRTYSVAWIDCLARGASLGRSLVFLAEHAGRGEIGDRAPFPPARTGRLAVPFDLPGWVLTAAGMRIFNEAYFRRNSMGAGRTRLVSWDPYFFPLDAIRDWNRIYGRRGFVQHQSVIPRGAGAERALGDILSRTARLTNASFLAVLKSLGPGAPGPLSFPTDGWTLAIDMPVQPGLDTLLAELDAVVVAAGGRIYLAKDARQSPDTFRAGYPALPAFQSLRTAIGAAGRIQSRMSRRLVIP